MRLSGSFSRAKLTAGALIAAVSLTALTACSDSDDPSSQEAPTTSVAGSDQPGSDQSGSEDAGPVEVTTNVGKQKQAVPVDKVLEVNATNGTLEKVTVKSPEGKISGELGEGSWAATGRLQPGTAYTMIVQAADAAGETSTVRESFTTQALTLDQQTYPSVAPLQGETVGVGMPVVVNFDVPVTDHAAFEKHMTVTSSPEQAGSWRWVSDYEAHWRPKTYWQAGTEVTVDIDVDSVPAGDGIYGQESRSIDFTIGDKVVSKVNAQTHQMKVFVNDKLERTIPITTGGPGHTTRSGVKVIMEKYRTKRMNSETVGIDPNSADGYDIDDVEYAMRVTATGEFVHAAPWSVGSQGYANVSHGCTGLSTENAGWLYGISKRGDIVDYTGTDRAMTADNGWGDWNLSWKDYQKGSALS